MFIFRKVSLLQLPSTSTRSSFQLDIRWLGPRRESFREFTSNMEQNEANLGKFVRVDTTGYSFTDSTGKRIAKYGIYWGKDDTRNGIRTLPDGASNVAAMLTAILEAINVAREEDPPPSLLIYSDLLTSDTLLRDLSGWAKRDFYLRNQEAKMKNSEILHDLFLAVQGLHLKIVHKPSITPEDPKNRVTIAIMEGIVKKVQDHKVEKLETKREGKQMYCSTINPVDSVSKIEIEIGTTLDKNGNIVRQASKSWPIVYVSARCKQNKEFVSAGYCTHWPDGPAGGKSFRYAPFPVTLFRAELAAIEEALKQTVDAELKNVTIITSSAHFMTGWQRRWIRTTEEHRPYTGKFYFDRICDLCARIDNVNFRYELESAESEIGMELEKKCTQGLSYALVGKDKSEYELELEDLVRDKEFRQEGVPIVRLYKTGTDFNAGYVWEESDGIQCCGTPSVLIRILEEAVARNESTILIRADSEKLIKSFEALLEVWRRTGWRNSQHKRIAKSAEWEKAWNLKQKIHVCWEIMQPVDEDDRRQNQRIPAYIKPSKS